jgi:hypothetical protein
VGTQVHLDPDVEALLKQQARERNLDFDRVLNDAVRAGLSTQLQKFGWKTLSPEQKAVDLRGLCCSDSCG